MSVTATRRPSSTQQASNITLHGGAGTLHQTENDSSDSTYATVDDDSYGAMKLGALSLPAGAVLQSVVLHCRFRGTPPTTLQATLGVDRAPITYTMLSGSFVTVGSAPMSHYSAAELAGGLPLVIVANSGATDVADIYADIVYFPIPVVTVIAPTGTIGVTQPAVNWNTTGDRPQSRFQVKVFSSAQYGAVGFDPDRSTPFYDSGERLGATRSFTPITNLTNGESYRFYVKAAQLAGSTTQWSAWDFTTATVSVTPPPVPVLKLTGQSFPGRIKVKATDSGSPTWDHVTIQRTADGGTTWVDVRSASRAPTTSNHFVVFDYESGNGQPVQYRARAIIADPAGDIASAWSPVSAPVLWESGDTWLKSVTNPTLNLVISIQSLPTLTRRLPRTVLDVAGRADPIVVADSRKAIEGTVTINALDDPTRDALQALLDLGEVLLLQCPAGDGFGSRYIAVGDEAENRVGPVASQPERAFVLPFVEVTAPVGDITTFGSTWDDVDGTFTDWDAVQAAYATWSQLIAADIGT